MNKLFLLIELLIEQWGRYFLMVISYLLFLLICTNSCEITFQVFLLSLTIACMDQEMRYSTLTAYQTPDHFGDVSSGLRSLHQTSSEMADSEFDPERHFALLCSVLDKLLLGLLVTMVDTVTPWKGHEVKVLFLNRSGAIPKSMLGLEV